MLPPARVTVGKNVGLHLSWFVYRGTGTVTFSPEQIMAWEDTRAGANSPWAPVWIAAADAGRRQGHGAGDVLGARRPTCCARAPTMARLRQMAR